MGKFSWESGCFVGKGERQHGNAWQHGNAFSQVDGNDAKIYIGRNGDAKQTKATVSVACVTSPPKSSHYGRAFLCSFPYFIRKVSVSITSAIIAMTSIAFSYFVTDGLLHS